jgi:chemotaxis protein methyltransferase CheR
MIEEPRPQIEADRRVQARSHNGVGTSEESTGLSGQKKSGLGTSIVKALAQQLEAHVEVLSGPIGTTVSITQATASAAR